MIGVRGQLRSPRVADFDAGHEGALTAQGWGRTFDIGSWTFSKRWNLSDTKPDSSDRATPCTGRSAGVTSEKDPCNPDEWAPAILCCRRDRSDEAVSGPSIPLNGADVFLDVTGQVSGELVCHPAVHHARKVAVAQWRVRMKPHEDGV